MLTSLSDPDVPTNQNRMTDLPILTNQQMRKLSTIFKLPTASVALITFALFALASMTGCQRLAERPSLGDILRGHHKPVTPDDSDTYPPPTLSTVMSSLDSSAVHLNGSVPEDDYGSMSQPGLLGGQAVRQAGYNDTQNGYGTASSQYGPNRYAPSEYTGRYTAWQYPKSPPSGYGSPQVTTIPTHAPAQNTRQPSQQAYQSFQNPVARVQNIQPQTIQPGVAAQAIAPPIIQGAPVIQGAPIVQGGPVFQGGPAFPNGRPSQQIPRALPGQPGFVPGQGTSFPPIGTSPVYTPTTRFADLIINGYPARTGRIMLGGAVNSDAGVTGQITIDERNFDIRRWPRSFGELFTGQAFRGAGETFRIEAAPGSDFDRYTAQWATPNLFNYLPISLSLSGFLYDRRFNDWDEQRKGARVSLGYRVTPDLSLSFGISGQEVKITNPTSSLAPELNSVLGRNDYFSGSVSLKHDTRNSPIQASGGHYFDFTFEQAFGDFDYSRFELEFRQYWLLADRIDGSGKQTLSYSTQLGFSGDETPIFENFFAGGYATIRGFDFRGASPVVNGIEVGGRFQWLNTVEYMFPITADDAFRGVAFVDFGTVEQDIEIDSDNFRVAPGVGVRVAIPALGPAPLAFDFAFPVAQAATDDERIFSFYMSLIR